MDIMLEKLLSAQVLSEETKAELTEAYQSLLKETEQKVEARLREEIAKRYESDKSSMVTAFELFLEQGLERELNEFRDDMKQVSALKKKYATAITQVKEQARQQIVDRMKAVESKVDAVLKKEMTEFHEDTKVSRKAYVKAIAENAAKAETDRELFKVKAAKVLESIINDKLVKEVNELREDIQSAKKTHFEGEIYEAFYNVFRRQFFDTNKEFKTLQAKLAESNKKVKTVVEAANAKIRSANTTIKAITSERNKLKESNDRKVIMDKLLGTLTGTSKSKMKALLETTDTKNLNKTYDKFIGDILNEDTKPRQTRKIDEAVSTLRLETGNRKALNESRVIDADLAEVEEIARLSGLGARK